MQKLVLFLGFAFFFQINVYAQKQDSTLFKGSGGYLSYGLHFMNLSSFNHSLEQYNLPGFEYTAMSVGIGGGTFLNRIYLGGKGAVHFGLSASNDLYQSKLYGGYGMVQVGYALVHTSSLALYPTLALEEEALRFGLMQVQLIQKTGMNSSSSLIATSQPVICYWTLE